MLNNNQKEVFLKSEGDCWFERNKLNEKISPDIALIKKYTDRLMGNILEVGCSYGFKLNEFKGNLRAFGLDPSESAIKEGSLKYPSISLSVGTSDDLKFSDNYFDVVVLGFCLYLVDRNLIYKTVYEIDRVLKDKGFLFITDFDSPIPVKRKYNHRDGVFSYKQQYANLFLANPSYNLVEKISYSHQSQFFHNDINERISTILLNKDTELGYINFD